VKLRSAATSFLISAIRASICALSFSPTTAQSVSCRYRDAPGARVDDGEQAF
jgi:hypothetical protein